MIVAIRNMPAHRISQNAKGKRLRALTDLIQKLQSTVELSLGGSPLASVSVAEAPMAIGTELRAARRARKRSIGDISHSTKIAPSILRALEHEDFAAVPGGLFTRGFLRAYAREVGLDGEDLVRRYRAEVEPPAVTTAASTSQPAALDAEDRSADLDEPSAGHTHVIQFAVILLVAVGYLVSLRPARPPTHIEAPVALRADAVPVATSGSTTTVPNSLTVDIHPTGPCWVEATSDGERVFGRLMDAGSRETIDVKENLTLRVGDPTTFAFSIDGAAGRSVGRPGAPATIRIDRANYESFLDVRPRSEAATADRRPAADAARAAACCPRTP
jgi:cytoskeletal protein RodZ